MTNTSSKKIPKGLVKGAQIQSEGFDGLHKSEVLEVFTQEAQGQPNKVEIEIKSAEGPDSKTSRVPFNPQYMTIIPQEAKHEI